MRSPLLCFFIYFLTQSYAYDKHAKAKSFFETFMTKDEKIPRLSSLKFLNGKYQRSFEPKQEIEIRNITNNYTAFPKNYLEKKVTNINIPVLIQTEHQDVPKRRIKKVLSEFWKTSRQRRSVNLNQTNTETEGIKAAVSEKSSASKGNVTKSETRSPKAEERRAAVNKLAAKHKDSKKHNTKKDTAKHTKTNNMKRSAARSTTKISNKTKRQDSKSKVVNTNKNNKKKQSLRTKHSSRSKASKSNKNKKKHASKSKKHASKTKAKTSNKNKRKRIRRTEEETKNKAGALKDRRSNKNENVKTVEHVPETDTHKATDMQVPGGRRLIEAGQFLPEAKRRLIAARETTIDNYPYVVSIQKDGHHWCSGALLNQRLVITTANCVWKSNRMSSMKIRACSSRVDSGGQVVNIAEVMKHPQWSIRKGPDFDVALLLTENYIRFSHMCHAVDLPNRGMMPVFEDAWVTSWGADTRDGVYVEGHPTRLQVHHVRLMDRRQCNNITMRFGVIVTENFLCVTQTGRRSPCTRDTGAPAVSDGVLWGLASWGLRKRCGTERYPAMYSYVGSPKNMDFIMKATHKLMSEERLSPFLDRYTPPKQEDKRVIDIVVRAQEVETTTQYEEVDLHLRSDKVIKNANLPKKPLSGNATLRALRRDFDYNHN